MKYKLIVSDFDGTLSRNDKTISERNKKAIADYTQKGGVFALCTGRMLNSILLQAQKLNLKGLVVGYNGGVIADAVSGRIIRDKRIDLKTGLEVIRILQDANEHIHAYIGEHFYVNKDDEYKKMYENLTLIQGDYVAEDFYNFIKNKGEDLQKLLCILPEEKKQAMMDLLLKKFGDKLIITTSAPSLIEIIDKKNTKGTALEFLASYYNIPVEETIGLGDSDNDTDLIKSAGLGVAMANATDSLKSLADEIGESNENDGVAKIIEKYGLTD